MFSITGATLAEVFGNVAEDCRYDERERSAARKIAEWKARLSEAEAARDRHHPIRDRAAYAAADAEVSRIRAERPYTSPKGRGFGPEDYRVFAIDGLTFVVRPHTTGNTMNVGVSETTAGVV
jgi:hypothetical protein